MEDNLKLIIDGLVTDDLISVTPKDLPPAELFYLDFYYKTEADVLREEISLLMLSIMYDCLH